LQAGPPGQAHSAVSLLLPGSYRIEVGGAGDASRVTARGEADIDTAATSFGLDDGAATATGLDAPDVTRTEAAASDVARLPD